jgi:putative endonuclease
MAIFLKWPLPWRKRPLPEHLQRGAHGERAAKKFLQRAGMKFLTANFASDHGEIDLIFRDQDCLVFVEVKTRSSEEWARPAAAVDRRKKEAIVRTARAYLRMLQDEGVMPAYRFDIVEVLLDETGEVREVRHLKQSFTSEKLFRRPRN